MKNNLSKLKLDVAIVAVALITTTSASAYSVTTGGTIVVGEGLTTSVADATVVDFDSSLINPVGYSGGAVKNGSSVNNWASPPNDSSNFYTVGPGAGQSSPGTVLLNSLSQYFGYYGGSPDTYNSVELWRDNTKLTTFSGSYLASAVPVPADGNWATGAYWNIWASNANEYFNIVKFVSSTNAFETDNHASLSAVPLPAAAWLFGTGLLGLFGLSKRQRKEA
jgi:hypothetical protein